MVDMFSAARVPTIPKTQTNGKELLPAPPPGADTGKDPKYVNFRPDPGFAAANVEPGIKQDSAGGFTSAQQRKKAADQSEIDAAGSNILFQADGSRVRVTSTYNGIVSYTVIDGPQAGFGGNTFEKNLTKTDPRGGVARGSVNVLRTDPARTNYNAAHMMPENQAEVRLARSHITAKQIIIIPDPEGHLTGFRGGLAVVDARTDSGYRVATQEELNAKAHLENLQEAINGIGADIANFDQSNAESLAQQAEDRSRGDITNAHDRALAELTKEFALDPELLAQHTKELDDQLNRAIDLVQQEANEDRTTARVKAFLDETIIRVQGDIDRDLNDTRQRFAEAQAQLDRDLRRSELAEATRSAQVLEALDRSRLDLENRQFKMGVFTQLASSPEMLYFMSQQTGVMDAFGDILEDGGEALNAMMERINERPTINIQDFQRLSSTDQSIEKFRRTAQTGETNTTAAFRGEAPRGFGQTTDLDAPISAGASGSTLLTSPTSDPSAQSPESPTGRIQLSEVTTIDGQTFLATDLPMLRSGELTVKQAAAKITKRGGYFYYV